MATIPAADSEIHQSVLMVWNWATLFLPRLGAAIAILIAGVTGSNWIARFVVRLLRRTPHIDPALKPIITAIVRYALLSLTFVATLDQLGFQTSSLLAVLGAAGLALGLALQGTLSNVASGIMLLWLRPFQIGDYIEVATAGSGTQGGAVEEIGLFGCRLRTFDGLFAFLPNSAIWNAPLKNHTRNGGRLINIDVSQPVSADIERARRGLLEAAAGLKNVLPDPPAQVFVKSLSANALVVSLTLWSSPQGAGEIERYAVERIKRSLAGLGGDLAPLEIVRAIPTDADPSRFLTGREPLAL